jgi:hypothetical protein
VTTGWEAQVLTAPACKNGASSCEPWERDWSKIGRVLKPGATVTDEGMIRQPDGISAWGIIAAVAPWAIVPPLVLLALGASLFWAFAGFRRSTP